MIDKIKIAEGTIKLAKDFIEVEKARRKVVTDLSVESLKDLQNAIIEDLEKNIKEIKENL